MNKVSARQKRINFTGWMFMLPALVFGTVFLIVPIVMCFVFSFTDFYMLRPESTLFVGFKNYADLFSDAIFGKAITNTLLFVVVVVPLQCLLALVLALLVNKRWRGYGVFKLAYFAPVITSMTVVALLFQIFYQRDGGIFNLLLSLFGVEAQGFLQDEGQAMLCICFMSVWQGAGYQMIIFLAGLQGVSRELYEAADIDAANAWDKLVHITLPSIAPVTGFVVIITLVGAFKVFTQVQIMTNGGPNNSTITVVYYIFQKGMSEQLVGYGSAISMLFTLVFVAASLLRGGAAKGVGLYRRYRERVLGGY